MMALEIVFILLGLGVLILLGFLALFVYLFTNKPKH